MKKSFLLTLLAVTVLLLAGHSCKDGIETPVPVIVPDQTAVSVEAGGNDVIIEYSIQNPISDAELKISCEAEWIRDIFNEDGSRFIFTVDPNTGENSRTAQIILEYMNAEQVCVTVTQAGNNPDEVPFEIAIDATTNASVTASVYPKDKNMTYMLMLTYKERFDGLGSDESNFQDDMDYYKSLADEAQMSLKDFIVQNNILQKGDVQGVVIDGLTPDTTYYVYVYGLTTELERITDIVKAEVATPEVTITDNSFEFNYTVNNSEVTGSVIPSDKTARYLTAYIDKESMQELYECQTIEEYAAQYISTEIAFNQLYYGMGLEDAVKHATVTGDIEFDYKLQPQTEYYLFAASVTLEGFINSKIAYKEIVTDGVKPSDNVLGMTVANTGMVSVDLDITATNDDEYGVKVFPKGEIEGMDNAALAEYIMEVRNFSLYRGTSKVILSGLDPETEYTAVAFGFDLNAYAITTQVWTVDFTTKKGEEVADVSFGFEFTDITSNTASLNLTVTPENALYIWGVIDNTVDASGIIDELNAECERYIELGLVSDRKEYMFQKAHSGSIEGYVIKDLIEEGEYRVYAVGLSFETAEFITDIAVSEPFRTVPAPLADIDIKVVHDKYFNGDELAAMYPDEFAGVVGYLLFPLDVEISGSTPAVTHKFHVYNGNIIDKDMYSDGFVKDFLNDYGSDEFHREYLMIPEKECTIVAYAMDAEGNHSPVFRELVKLSLDGASPAEEYVFPTSQQLTSTAEKQAERMFRVISNDSPVTYSEPIAVVEGPRADRSQESAFVERSLRNPHYKVSNE